MNAYDSQYIAEYRAIGYDGYDGYEEECPHCAAMIVPEIDCDDVVFCPKCHMIIREPEPEAPQGVDEEEVPL
jgi:uncharacterized paraquat-inducible protein A